MKVKNRYGFIVFAMQVLCGDIVKQDGIHKNIQEMSGEVVESSNSCTGAVSNDSIIPGDEPFDRSKEKQNGRTEDLPLIPMLTDASPTEHTEDGLGISERTDFVKETVSMMNLDERLLNTHEVLPLSMEETKVVVSADEGHINTDESLPMEEIDNVNNTVIVVNADEGHNTTDEVLLSMEETKVVVSAYEGHINADESLPMEEIDNVNNTDVVVSTDNNNFNTDEVLLSMEETDVVVSADKSSNFTDKVLSLSLEEIDKDKEKDVLVSADKNHNNTGKVLSLLMEKTENQTEILMNLDECHDTTDEASSMEETENITEVLMNCAESSNFTDEVSSSSMEETGVVVSADSGHFNTDGLSSLSMEETEVVVSADKGHFNTDEVSSSMEEIDNDNQTEIVLSIAERHNTGKVSSSMEEIDNYNKTEVLTKTEESSNNTDEVSLLLANTPENDYVKESEIVASNNYSLDEARNVIAEGPGIVNDIKKEIVTSNKKDSYNDEVYNSVAEGSHAIEEVIMAIKGDKYPVVNTEDCEQNLLTTTDDQNQEIQISIEFILTLKNVPYDTLALNDAIINNKKFRCRKILEYVYSFDELYEIRRSMLQETLDLENRNKKIILENTKMTLEKHTQKFYKFDYEFGIRSALLRHSGGMQKYENIIIGVKWGEVSFISRPYCRYFDFERFYINHKRAFLPKSTMDRRIKSITSASPKQKENIHKCKQIVKLIELLENKAYYMKEEDLIKLFESKGLKSQAKLHFINARDITQIITSKTSFTYKMFDLEPKHKFEISHIFGLHLADIKRYRGSILDQRDIFFNCMSSIFFDYDGEVQIRFFKHELSNLLRFMPEFNLYLIWKFKEMYKWNVEIEPSKHKARYLEEEMAIIMNIFPVLSQVSDNNFRYRISSEYLHEKIRNYRAFIFRYLTTFYSNTLTYCLFKQGCEIDTKPSTAEGNRLSMIFFLLAFMDESEILSTNDIKDDVNRIKYSKSNERTEKKMQFEETVQHSSNEKNEHRKEFFLQADNSKQNLLRQSEVDIELTKSSNEQERTSVEANSDVSYMQNINPETASDSIKSEKVLNEKDIQKEVTREEESSDEDKYFSADDFTNEEVPSEDVSSEDVPSEDVISEDALSDEVLNENVLNENVLSQVLKEKGLSKKVTSEEVANVKNRTAQEKNTNPTNAKCSNIDFDIFSVFEKYLEMKNVDSASIDMSIIRSNVYSRLHLLQPYLNFSFVEKYFMMDSMPVILPLEKHVLVIYQNILSDKIQVVVLNDAQAIALFCDYINIALRKGTKI